MSKDSCHWNLKKKKHQTMYNNTINQYFLMSKDSCYYDSGFKLSSLPCFRFRPTPRWNTPNLPRGCTMSPPRRTLRSRAWHHRMTRSKYRRWWVRRQRGGPCLRPTPHPHPTRAATPRPLSRQRVNWTTPWPIGKTATDRNQAEVSGCVLLQSFIQQKHLSLDRVTC